MVLLGLPRLFGGVEALGGWRANPLLLALVSASFLTVGETLPNPRVASGVGGAGGHHVVVRGNVGAVRGSSDLDWHHVRLNSGRRRLLRPGCCVRRGADWGAAPAVAGAVGCPGVRNRDPLVPLGVTRGSMGS